MLKRRGERASLLHRSGATLAILAAVLLVACTDTTGDADPAGADTIAAPTDAAGPGPGDAAAAPEDVRPDLQPGPADAAGEPDAPGDAIADAAADTADLPVGPQRITMGPALYHVRPDRVTVLFETEHPGAGRVEILDGDDVVRTLETEGVVPDNSWYPFPTADFEGYVHQVVVDGLDPVTRYTYRVAAADAGEGPYSFVTAPPDGSGAFRLVIFGDNRTNHDDHRRVVDEIVDLAPDIVLNTGDVVDVGVSQSDWHMFFAIEHALLATTPSWMTIGNHESVLGTPHSARYFAIDTDAPFNGFVQRVTYGPLRLLVLNSQVPFAEGEQLAWVEEELAAAEDDPDVRYLFVTFHQPLYTFSNHGPHTKGREVYPALFAAHGVQAVFTGHNHVYERFLVDDVHYVVTGGGGAPQYGIDSHVVEEEVPLRKAARQALHVVLADIDEERAEFTVVNTDNGETIDSWTVDPL